MKRDFDLIRRIMTERNLKVYHLISLGLVLIMFSLSYARVPDIVLKQTRAVVTIIISDKDANKIASGSGFIIDANGVIATNYHVVSKWLEPGNTMLFKMENGAYYPVEELISFDEDNDIALVKIAGKGLPVVKFSKDLKAKQGDGIVVIGSPLGLETTVSDGIISSVRGKDGILQITAPISPGSSGSPVFNSKGEVIGVATYLIKGGQNLNFAIPINYLTQLTSSRKPVYPPPTSVSRRQKSSTDDFTNTYREPTIGMEPVHVKGGCYQMGYLSEDNEYKVNKPKHEVCVDDFYMGKYLVTQGQWQRLMGNNPSYFKNCGENCPVEQVSWIDVQAFIKKLKLMTGQEYRLPTEAEWEYAATSGGKEMEHFGYLRDGTRYHSNFIESEAWYAENSGLITHPVGTKDPNRLGLYDMLGNVWQWTGDWHGDNYHSNSPRSNPLGPSSGVRRVRRGGSYFFTPQSIGVTSPNDTPAYRYKDIGFRLALSPGGDHNFAKVDDHQSEIYDEAKHLENDPGVDMCYVKSTSLNLRSEPSVSGSIIKKLRRGNSLVLINRETVNGWFNVIDIGSGEEGWVNGTAITIKHTENPKKTNPFQAEKVAGLEQLEILITNDSYKDMKLKIGLQGYKVDKHTSLKISHDAGTFEYHASAPGVLPAFGKNTFENGYRYTWRFWIATK